MTKNTKKRGTNKQRVPRKTTKAAKRKPVDGKITQLARMVSDPCGGPLTKGLYGDNRGILSRFRTTTNSGVVGSTYSVILWNPVGKSPQSTTADQRFNVLWYQTNNSSSTPSTTNWGYNPTLGGVASAQDPENPAIYGSARVGGAGIASQSRTLAACIRAVYTGEQAKFKGMVFPLTNIPSDIMNNSPSIDVFRQYATHGSRNFEQEVRYTPSRAASELVDVSAAASSFISGTGPKVDSVSPDATLIGMLFFNCDVTDFAIDLYKVVEWLPEIGRGFPSCPIENIGEYDTFSTVVAFMSRTFGSDWQTRMLHNAGNAIVEAISNLSVGAGRRAPGYRSRITM